MTLDEFQTAAMRTAPMEDDSMEELLHGAIGVCTEVGELMDAIKKHRYYGKPLDMVNVREEAFDCFWYLALICQASGTSLEAVAQAGLAKLRARYPDKFDAELAVNRDTDNERRVLEDPSYVALRESQEERE